MAADPARHRIEVVCPDCGHAQSEPSLVVSTACRACGMNFQVKDGKAVARVKPSTRFSTERPPPRRQAAEEEEEDQNQKGAAATPKPGASSPSPASPSFPFRRPASPVAPPAQGLFQRWFRRPAPPRRVVCFDCGREHTAVPAAQSSQCPWCGSYVSLRDYVIDERWNRRIQTRGDVTINRHGAVAGVPITCHHLTVLGELAAAVDCSGDLVIIRHGKIPGKVRCHTLKVEKGAKVEFLHAVEAAEVRIEGQVTGQIHCSGTVVLEKRAELRGLVRAARLKVKQGAKHSGAIEIVQPPANEDTAPPSSGEG